MTARRTVGFDGWRLHRDTGELHRDGVRLRLQSQPLQVLDALLERPGELVTRETLIARLWPRGVVDFDTALNSAVRRLRTALGDRSDAPRYIETIPKRGYRFIGRLDVAPEPGLEASVVVRSAPVLPAAVTGETRSPATPARVRPGPALLTLVLVVGSLLTGLLAWPAWHSDDMPTLMPAPVGRTADVPASAEAAYRQGRFLLQRRGPGDVASARDRFEAALALYPGHARAWAGIASTWWLDVVEQRRAPAEGLAAVKEAAARALELDPGIAEAHLRLANVARESGERTVGDAHLRRAEVAEPDDPLVLSFAASAAASRGDWSEAVAVQRRAVDVDPLAGASRFNLAVFLYFAGRYDEASRQLQELRALNPNDGEVAALLGVVRVLAGNSTGALEVAAQLDEPEASHQIRALAHFALGRREESDRALRALTERADGERAYMVAEVHAFRGEPDAAFRWLDVAVNAPPGRCRSTRCLPPDWLPALPLLRLLAADARWSRWIMRLEARAPG